MWHETGDGWLADVRQALSVGPLVEPPRWMRERAKELFSGRLTMSGRNLSSWVARVRASLLFDSRRPGSAAAGVRSPTMLKGSLEGPWQLLYRGGSVDVDLLVRPNQDGRTLNVRGQALPLAGGSVGAGIVEAQPVDSRRLLNPPPASSSPKPALRADVEPSGEFALPNLERGRYDMLLRFGAHEIELSGVEL
jgi:hypothetical protein